MLFESALFEVFTESDYLYNLWCACEREMKAGSVDSVDVEEVKTKSGFV